MDPVNPPPSIIIQAELASLNKISEYLDVLSSSAWIRIANFLGRKHHDAREIPNEIDTSYENPKKHIDTFLGIGVTKKVAGHEAPISKEVLGDCPAAIVPGMPDAVKAFILKMASFTIRRNELYNPVSFDPETKIVLPYGHPIATWVSKHYGRFIRETVIRSLKDCVSTWETQLNMKKVLCG